MNPQISMKYLLQNQSYAVLVYQIMDEKYKTFKNNHYYKNTYQVRN